MITLGWGHTRPNLVWILKTLCALSHHNTYMCLFKPHVLSNNNIATPIHASQSSLKDLSIFYVYITHWIFFQVYLTYKMQVMDPSFAKNQLRI